jgi:hypothetical protein
MKTKTHFAFRVATGSSADQDISNRTVRAGRVHRALGSRGFFFSEIGSGAHPTPRIGGRERWLRILKRAS